MTRDTLSGSGTLHYKDGREWGPVDYDLEIRRNTTTRIGSIQGRLRPVGPERLAPLPFFNVMEAGGIAHLELEDGRWWVCLVQPNGRAVTSASAEPDGFFALRPVAE